MVTQTPPIVAVKRTSQQNHPKIGDKFIKNTTTRGPGMTLSPWPKLISGTKVSPIWNIMAIELVWHKLQHYEVKELRSEVNRALKVTNPKA